MTWTEISREKQTSPPYQRLSSTCYGPSRLCVLHFAVEPFTARDGARYWLRMAIFAYRTCIRRPRSVRRSRSQYCHDVWYEKLEWCRYTIVKRDVYSFRQSARTLQRDGIGRAYVKHRAAKRLRVCVKTGRGYYNMSSTVIGCILIPV